MYNYLMGQENSPKNGKNRCSSEDILSSLSSISIPPSIFHRYSVLAVLESIAVYLKDESNLNYHDIGILLNRDQRNVWTVYNRAKKKLSKLADEQIPSTRNNNGSENVLNSLSYISIPPSIFHKYSTLAVLESIAVYLKDERNLNYHDIGILLNRDQRNIWTVYDRAKKKLSKLANEKHE